MVRNRTAMALLDPDGAHFTVRLLLVTNTVSAWGAVTFTTSGMVTVEAGALAPSLRTSENVTALPSASSLKLAL